jgi:hypothetical protein
VIQGRKLLSNYCGSLGQNNKALCSGEKWRVADPIQSWKQLHRLLCDSSLVENVERTLQSCTNENLHTRAAIDSVLERRRRTRFRATL